MYGLIGVVVGAVLALAMSEALEKYRERKSTKAYLDAKRAVDEEWAADAKKMHPRIPVKSPFQI